MKNYLLGCDWGTSSFRLRLIRIADHQLVGEIVSPDGVASTFTAWKKQGEPMGLGRDQFFRQQLNRQINRLTEKVGVSVDGACLVISRYGLVIDWHGRSTVRDPAVPRRW